MAIYKIIIQMNNEGQISFLDETFSLGPSREHVCTLCAFLLKLTETLYSGIQCVLGMVSEI